MVFFNSARIRAITVPDNAAEGLPRLIEVWHRYREPAQAGVGVGDDSGQRLVYLVRD
jgi:hypothetical protein